MKRIGIFLLALGMVACGAPDENALILTDAIPYEDVSCSTRAGASQTRGSLDISSTSRYIMTFTVLNNMRTPSVIVSGRDLSSGQGANIFAEQVELSYQSTPSFTFEDEIRPQHAVFGPGSGWLGANLIGPKAYTTLVGSVGAGQSIDLLVSLRLLGATVGGTQVSSNRVTFPIQVYNSGFGGCPSGVKKVVDGACGNSGQDGSIVGCCNDAAYSGLTSCQ